MLQRHGIRISYGISPWTVIWRLMIVLCVFAAIGVVFYLGYNGYFQSILNVDPETTIQNEYKFEPTNDVDVPIDNNVDVVIEKIEITCEDGGCVEDTS